MSANAIQTISHPKTIPSRVLLVDSNKGNRHLLASRLLAGLGLKVEVAANLVNTQQIIDEHASDFFVAVVNVNLKDAPDGEIVDLINKHSIPVIAFSMTDDVSLREKITNKFVLDYLVIKNWRHFEQIEFLVERIRRSYETTVLLVDSSSAFQFYIRQLLDNHQFIVLEAQSVEQALDQLEARPEIKLVITDASPDGIDGLALIEQIRVERKPQSLGIVAMSSSNNPQTSVDLLKAGATDYIRKPFAYEEFYCRINQNVDTIDYIERIQNSMTRDYLTGVFNRRYLYDAGTQAYLNARRGNITIAVAMIDADSFKTINDTYGHETGDRVLKEMATVMQKTLRGSDIVARFGGEEFVCIANCIDAEFVEALFERVRLAIESLEIDIPGGVLKVTASIGVTSKLGNSLEETIKMADNAMYSAKQRGRNCVVIE